MYDVQGWNRLQTQRYSRFLDSSVQPWYDFAQTYTSKGVIELQHHQLAPCELPQSDMINATKLQTKAQNQSEPSQLSCVDICGNYKILIDPTLTSNLLNCGLWASLATLWLEASAGWIYNTTGVSKHKLAAREIEPFLEDYHILGLYHENTSAIFAARGCVSRALSELLTIDSIIQSLPRNSFHPACSEQNIFNFDETTLSRQQSGVLPCIEAICTSTSLNPDLGGIGVRRQIPSRRQLLIKADLHIS